MHSCWKKSTAQLEKAHGYIDKTKRGRKNTQQNTRVEENIRITKKFYDTFIRDNTGDTSLVYLKLKAERRTGNNSFTGTAFWVVPAYFHL